MSDSESPVELVLADGRVVCCDNGLDCEPLKFGSVCVERSLCDVSAAEGAPCCGPLAKFEDKVGPIVTDECGGDSELVENTPKSRDIDIPVDVETPVVVETPVDVEIRVDV